MNGELRALARGLGNAFLSGPWEPAAMLSGGAEVLGARRRWLRPVIRQVLAAYPRPPVDRPRELAAFVAGCPEVIKAVNTAPAGRPARARRIPPAPTRMADRRPWPVPVLDNERDLARLLELDPDQLPWFADVKGMQRRAQAGPLHHYRYQWRLARSGRARLLEAPRPRLRQAQRTLLDQVLALIPVHPAVHGFVPGRSAVSAARVHAGSPIVISLDLESFFSSLNAARVYGVFRAAGYPQPVAHLLTGLCTTRTPVRVLGAMPTAPPGADLDARFRQRRLLAAAHLPQGAPSSPALANLCVLRLDRRLAGYARTCGLVYTRYADDLVFSVAEAAEAAEAAALRPERLAAGVAAIATDEGLRVQPDKTRVQRAHQRQSVAGIVVNARPNLAREEFDQLKALLHNAVRFGPQSQNREQHPDFRAHLLGRIGWLQQLNPARAARLRTSFDAITW
jgi:RNA-directed DNA polymerase